jgi:flagellar biosynthesis component FlhA
MLSDGEAQLRAHLIDPAWAELAERDMSTGHGEVLRAAIRRASAIGYGGSRWRIVLVVKLAVRALVADLLRVEFPHVTVVAFEEIPAWVTLEPISQHVGATAR